MPPPAPRVESACARPSSLQPRTITACDPRSHRTRPAIPATPLLVPPPPPRVASASFPHRDRRRAAQSSPPSASPPYPRRSSPPSSFLVLGAILSSAAATVPLAPARSRSDVAARLRVATCRNRRHAHMCSIQPPWSSSPSSPWQELSSKWAPSSLPAWVALYMTLPPLGPPPWRPPSATLPAPP
jgi:hypothetical protein